MLGARIITGFILACFVIGSIIYLPRVGFNLLAVLFVTLAAWEYTGFFAKENYKRRLGFLAVFLLIFVVSQVFSIKEPILLIGVLWWLFAPYFLWRYTVDKKYYFTTEQWQWFVGLIVFVPCLVGLIEIYEKFGARFLLYLLAIVCSADIGAYFSGRLWGKKLLASKISPKKTIEGLLGGVLVAMVVTVYGALLLMFGSISWQGLVIYFSSFRGVSLMLLAVVVCLWSVIGDLFESMLKRQAGIKDSGCLLPGHGGMYDRLDSLTAALPLFVLGLLLINLN